MKFVGAGTILAGKSNVRRLLLVNGAHDVTLTTGKLDMFVTEPRGTPVRGESVRLDEVCWIPLLPPEKPGLYAIRFYASLDSGARLEARGLLTVVGGEERQCFVVRYGGRPRAWLNRCAHVPMELDWLPGKFFDAAGLYLICATHGATYEPDTGRCVAGPCRGAALEPVPVSEHDGAVWVDPQSR